MTQIDQSGSDPASALVGIDIVEIGSGSTGAQTTDPQTTGTQRVATRMVVTPGHLNALGVCHGGFLFTLADAAMAELSNRAVPAAEAAALAANAEIDFLRPATEGAVLTATAHTTAVAGRTSVHDVTITDQDGSVIAVFRGRTRTVTRR